MSASPYEIDIQLQLAGEEIPAARLSDAIEWVLRDHEVAPGAGVSVVVMDDGMVQAFNRQYRDVDRPTDVLSFPAEDDPDLDEEGVYLGDLILALPYIRRQAASEQHDPDDELVLAVVHGTLHLLGYDHDSPENQAAMWTVQSRALQALSVEIEVPLFEFDDDDEPDDPVESGDQS
ncbi:MAG: rRNA maturation RNase YbeY [Chloroflexi bacterium]|nr:rRNA maturation RNase YbeY [Chloroflexota bacterium]